MGGDLAQLKALTHLKSLKQTTGGQNRFNRVVSVG